METRKIALACFLGGSVFVALTLMFTPNYWWLGLLSGVAGGFTAGYLGYDIKEVVRKIPVVFRQMKSGAKKESLEIYNGTLNNIKDFFSPHPFIHFTTVLALLTGVCLFMKEGGGEVLLEEITFLYVFIIIIGVATGSLIGIIIFAPLLSLLATIGSRFGEKCYWLPFVTLEGKNAEEKEKELIEKGYVKKPMTYASLFRWISKGILIIFQFFTWTMWKYIVIAIAKIIPVALLFCLRFVWKLFVTVHSKKRMLCGIDGVLGGTLAFYCSLGMALTTAEEIMFVLFGGGVGSLIGILDYEIMSKRILMIKESV